MPKTNKNIEIKARGADIFIHSDVDQLFGFSSQELVDSLRGFSANDEIRVHINSLGGDVYEGIGIYNTLSRFNNVVTIGEGIVGSISSLIFLAGTRRQIFSNAMVFIHDPFFTKLSGNIEDVEGKLEFAKKTRENIRNIYKTKLNATAEQVEQWLKDEKDFTAEEALEFGIATEIIDSPSLLAASTFSLSGLVSKLTALMSRDNTQDPTPPAATPPSPAGGGGPQPISSPRKEQNMKAFDTWLADYCKPLGLQASALTDEQKLALKATYDSQRIPTPPPLPGDDDSERRLAARRQREAEEEDRVEGIRAYAKANDNPMSEEYLKELGIRGTTSRSLVSHAIKEGWSVDKFELEMRRASRPEVGHVGIHTSSADEVFSNTRAMSAALARDAGVPFKRVHKITGKEYGLEAWYKPQELEVADNPRLRNLGLHQILDMAHVEAFGHRYPGRCNTDGFISAVRDAMWKLKMAGSTTWSGLNIFDDAANKMLWSAYEAQNTTWQEWVKVMSVSDFKTHNAYRLTSQGTYQQLGAQGELKYGGFTDDKYTHSAETYGRMLGLLRRDIINDDLGALSNLMTMLGAEGAKFLEELFYVHFLGQLTTLFPTADTNNNYISGAATDLGVDGLTTLEQKARDQVDADNAPILTPVELLLVGTQDAVLAAELYNQVSLQGLQTANAKKRPDQNPHVGKFRPIVSGYLNNTNILQRITNEGQAVTGQSSDQWFGLRPPGPQGGIVIGSFLNGVTTPTIEQGDMDFQVLGLRWRAYHDAGADNGDPKWGVMSKGAA